MVWKIGSCTERISIHPTLTPALSLVEDIWDSQAWGGEGEGKEKTEKKTERKNREQIQRKNNPSIGYEKNFLDLPCRTPYFVFQLLAEASR